MTNMETEKTILVVDDMPQNITLLRVILKHAGYHVIEANSGPQALELVEQQQPDAMILDVRMPGMTGYEVCKKIRSHSNFATLPIIMITALSGTDDRIKGIEAGATDFITKPFDRKELLARIKASLTAAKATTNAVHHATITNIPGGTISTDPQWVVLEASKEAAELIGKTPEQLVGQNILPLLKQNFALPQDANDPSTTESWDFHQNENVENHIAGTHTAVINVDGQIVMRVLTLQTAKQPESQQ